MISSMTAFGRSLVQGAGYSISVEVRTLNSRNLDIILRMPKQYSEFEDSLRRQVSKALRRGRVEIFMQVDTTKVELKAPRINMQLARFYWQQLQELHCLLPGSDPPTLAQLLQVPHLYEAAEQEEDREVLGNLMSHALDQALDQVKAMRAGEGEALLRDLLERLGAIQEELAFVESQKDAVLEEYQSRLKERLQELLANVELDENRVIQEVAILAERSDINEEIVRLRSHLDQMEGLLKEPQMADGRRLDFLTQELHREANTIGCKSGDLEIIQAVLTMKSEVGKLKEQVQNVE